MRYLIIALIAYLAVAVQTTLVDAIEIGRIGPEVPAAVAAAILLLQRGNAALVVAAAIGLVEDALWPGRLGVAMAWYLLLSWVLLEGCERFDLHRLGRPVAVSGVFAGLLVLGTGATRCVLGEPTVGLGELAMSAVGVGLYTTAFAVPFWLVAAGCRQAFERHLSPYDV